MFAGGVEHNCVRVRNIITVQESKLSHLSKNRLGFYNCSLHITGPNSPVTHLASVMLISSGWSRTECDMSVTTGARFHSFSDVCLGTIVQNLLCAFPLPSGPEQLYLRCLFIQPLRVSVISKFSHLLVLLVPWFHTPISFFKVKSGSLEEIVTNTGSYTALYMLPTYTKWRITCESGSLTKKHLLWAQSNTTY